MLCHGADCDYGEFKVLFTVTLSVVMLNVVMLSVVMLSVVMQDVVAPLQSSHGYKIFYGRNFYGILVS
jgi:hypothetical protein